MKTFLLAHKTTLACALILASVAISNADLVAVCNGGGATTGASIIAYDETTGQPTARLSASAESFEGVTSGPYGEIYATCNTLGYGDVIRFSPEGELIGVFAGAQLMTPGNLKFGPDGHLYVLGSTWPEMPARGHLIRYNGQTGGFMDRLVVPGRAATVLTDFAFGTHHLYLADFHRGVFRFDARTGKSLGLFAPVVRGELSSPVALTIGPGGNLFVASRDSHAVLKIRGRDGAFLGAFVPPRRGGLLSPMGLSFGPDGHLYVSSHRTHSILKYDGRTGQFLATFASAESGLAYPTKISFSIAPVVVASN